VRVIDAQFKFFTLYRQKRKEKVHPKMTAEEVTKVY